MATPDKIEQRLREILSKVAPRVKERAAVGEDEGDAVPLSADELKRIFGKVRTKLGLPYAAIEEPMEAEERSTMSRYLSSGFDALDNLLGGDGFQKGASILLRGQAGTGKTTLALQIAKNAIDKQGHAFVYASVEDPPEVLLNHITRSFWDVDFEAFLGDPKQWAVENLTEYWDIDVNKTAYIRLLEEFINEHSDKFDMEEQNALRQYPDELRPLMDEILGPERLRDAIRERMREMELDRLLCKLWERIPIFDARPIILVVDSLNALINGAKTRFRNYTDRQMLLSVHQSFETWRRKKRDQLTVLFIVEDDPNVATAAAESYVADVIIDLVFEEVPITPDDRGGLSQQMRFCRVLKGRGLPTQTRSCCYEFVKGDQNENSDERGIKFFPTYAAPGIVYLFHENKPQLDDIEALRTIDMRSDFPRVQVEDFTRSGLQRMFSVHRHSKRIPLRQPLLLSHVDEYWVVALKEAGLLLPIPSRDLLPHSMRLQDSGTSGKGTQFIKELTNKTNMFCGKDRHNNAAHYAVPHMANVGILVYRKDLLDAIGERPPRTWEKLEEICMQLSGGNTPRPHKLLLETKTYDTLLATALEMGWGHGAFWRTVRGKNDSLHVEFDNGSGVGHLVAALVRLQYLIHRARLVPPNSSVDPDNNPPNEWVFARHWYSTWVDVCTRSDRKGSNPHFGKGAEYGLAPLPVAKSLRDDKGEQPEHHSCWGEWYLAIQNGSENLDLGVDLINSLMTARKISERALSGAALPTVEQFYKISGNQICPYTDQTFNDIREMFFKSAKSRTEFEDYYRVARIFSGTLNTLVTNPAANVVNLVRTAFAEMAPDFKWPKDVWDQVKQLLPKRVWQDTQ